MFKLGVKNLVNNPDHFYILRTFPAGIFPTVVTEKISDLQNRKTQQQNKSLHFVID